MAEATVGLHVKVNMDELDAAIEKANRLVSLLEEACRIVDLLSGKDDQSEP